MITQTIIIIILFFSASLKAQYLSHKFTGNDGMRSSLVRCIVKDKSGFLWIGSDGGIMRFDGKKFVSYHKLLPSIFIKAMHITSSGTFYVAHDKGFGIIESQDNQYTYRSIAEVGNSQADTALYYPKSIFEDSRGRIWIGDLTGMSVYQKGVIKKYYFSSSEHSDSYFRGFCAAENGKGEVIISSMRGSLFWYDEVRDVFVRLAINSPIRFTYISTMIKYDSGTLLIGTNNGIYKVYTDSKKKSATLVRMIEFDDISTIVSAGGKAIIFGTWNDGLYIASLDGKVSTDNNFQEYSRLSIKALHYDLDGIWVGTDDGLFLFQRRRFIEPKRNFSEKEKSPNSIRTILYDKPEDKILICDGKTVEAFDIMNPQKPATVIFKTPRQDILNLAISPKGYWISYLKNLIEFRDKKTLRVLYSYSRLDDSFHSLYVDEGGNLWGYLPLTRQIIKISAGKDVKYYHFPEQKPIYINKIGGYEGKILASGTTDGVLFYEIDSDTENIKAHYFNARSELKTPIQVFDFITDKNNEIVFATSEGAIYYNLQDKDGRISTQELQGRMLKSVIKDKKGNYWYGGDGKIFSKHQQDYLNFGKQDGLYDGAVLQQGLILDKRNRIWAGYPLGVVYSDTSISEFANTRKPEMVNIFIDDVVNYIGDTVALKTKNTLELEFISPVFPGSDVLYQHRIKEISERWSEPDELSAVKLIALPPGEYSFQFRARSPNSLWSDISTVNLHIAPPWYSSAYSIILYCIIGVIFIYMVVVKYNDYRLQKAIKREKELSELVSLRTAALESEKKKTEALLVEKERAYSELTDLTEQKNILIGIVVHDLKNPIHAIMGFADLVSEATSDPEIKSYSKIISESSQKMVDLINNYLETTLLDENLVNYNPNIIFSLEVVTEAVRSNQLLAKKKNQNIITELNQDCQLYADKELITRAIANVINNAIKYSQPGSLVLIRDGLNQGYFELRVKDEGPGFSEEDKRYLFSKLTRLSAKPTGGESSTGVGLYYVKIIINKCGGEIVLEESGQNGSTFLFRLPVYNGVAK